MGRMAKFQEEMAKSIPVAPTAPSPTQQVKIPELVSEVERLRSRVAEMEIEREEARKKRSRSLSVPSPDLVGGPDLSLQEWGALHGQRSWRLSSAEGALWLRVPTGSAHWLEGSGTCIPLSSTSIRDMGWKSDGVRLVRQVHTHFVRSAQVDHELQVQEEVEGVRQEVREVKGESKVEERRSLHGHVDDMDDNTRLMT